jgi:stearoyl-CoA desaturase (delta-9 desaturase)
MKMYNVLGFATLVLQLLLSAFLAPPGLGPWWGMIVGFGYLLISWFIAGVYLSDVIHLGIAHRALDFKEWFIKTVTVINNAFGVYVDPVSWVSRHRLHHKFADHEGDPNKLGADGFWKTMYLCLFPYPCKEDMGSRLEIRHRSLVRRPGFRTVGKHGSELLDPRPSLGLAAL